MSDNTVQRIDDIVGEQKRLAGRLYDQLGETDKIHKRLDGVEDTLEVIRSAIVGSYDRDGLRSAVARIESVSEENKRTSERNSTKIDTIASGFNTHTVRINVLTAIVSFCLLSVVISLIVTFFGG